MDTIIVLDFGGQYCHLIARRVRDLGVYSEILPFDVSIEKLKTIKPKGIILSGGPNSVYEKKSPKLSKEFYNFIFEEKIPVLGICYGLHLIIHQLNGKIEPHNRKEYGKTKIEIIKTMNLLESLDKYEIVWMSHGDQVKEMPDGFEILAKTDTCPIAAYGNKKKNYMVYNFTLKLTIQKKEILF